MLHPIVVKPALMAIAFLAVVANSAIADQLEGIQEFTDGNPALATEVNDNNRILSDKAQELDARVRLLEDTSMRLIRQETAARYSLSGGASSSETVTATLVELEGGKLILDNVDCTQNPHALNQAYIENSRFKDLTFIIKGDCYGDYWLLDGNNPDAGVRQEFGQSVKIQGNIGTDPDNPLPRPRLIPNPLTGRMSLVGSFGGGLYLTDVDIVGGNQFSTILFSRGATGSVRNVNIQCSTTYEGLTVGARVQNGAVPYFEGNIDISGCNWGMWVFNNSTVALFGDLNIDATDIGLYVSQNSSINSVLFRDTVVNITSEQTALIVDQSNIELALNNPSSKTMDVTGDMVFRSSQVKLNAPLRLDSDGTLLVNNSVVNLFPLSAGGDLNTEADYLSSTDLSNRTTCEGNGSFNPINRVSSSPIAVTDCWNDTQWKSLYSGAP